MNTRKIAAGVMAAAIILAVATPAADASVGAVSAAKKVPTARGPRRSSTPMLVYAPYFQTSSGNNIPTIASQSGARDFTLSFLQTARAGSCTITWNGSQAVRAGDTYASQIASLRAMGGQAVPSFGGYAADESGTEIADSCTSVQKIAQAYESVVTDYGATRLDMDVEGNSLGNQAGITRRSEALSLLQQWAKANNRQVQIVFTLGVGTTGMPSYILNVLQNAIAHGVTISAVNIMAFDYSASGTEPTQNMGANAVAALNATYAQLAQLYPKDSSTQVWQMIGITLLPGIDDNPGDAEITTLANVQVILNFIQTHPISLITIWTIQRDNGGCPGVGDSGSCSGIVQPTWAFSQLIEKFISTGG